LDWLASAYMPWVDFRGADLAHTHWGHATLTHADFQCANLEGADLHLANLQKADLRGASLTGAKLPRNAKLKWGVKTAGAVGPVYHLHIVKPAVKYAPDRCRTTKAYATVPAPFLLPARPGLPVPASAIQRLTAAANPVVKDNGGVAPAWVSVVTTTYEKALMSAIPGDIVPGAASTTVYLVTMKGHFTSTMHSSKAVPASGKYLSIVVNAETFGITDLGLSRKPPRVAPACCGPVTYLQGVGTAARE
jgi:Pentapeptide repeats (8 copies)